MTVVLSVILIILIIVRIIQFCRQRKVDQIEKKSKGKARSLEDGPGEDQSDVDRFTAAVPAKQEKKKKSTTCCKKSKNQKTEVDDEGALIVPTNENGSLLHSGIRAHPTRKVENKSWYDSKVIPFIDEGGASLDNLYIPEKSIYEVV
ncbi:hypothetical protein ACTXT7_010009 [Hymenolepis weldensis]